MPHTITLKSSAHHQVDTPATPLPVIETAKLFFTSLFDPFINQDAQDFYSRQWENIETTGLIGYTYEILTSVAKTAVEHPLDTVLIGGGIALGYVDSRPLRAAVLTTSFVKQGKSIKALADSINCKTPSGKKIRALVLTTGAVCLLSSLPAAAASITGTEYHTLEQAQNTYQGGACSDPVLTRINSCLKKGTSLQKCCTIGRLIQRDCMVFTRHPSSDPTLDPVSQVTFDPIQDTTCYLTKMGKDSVTKTCIDSDLEIQSVDVIEALPLQQAHVGLKPGESITHVAVKASDAASPCGSFSSPESEVPLTPENAACFLSAQRSGGKITQLCIDPKRPEHITLKLLPEDVLAPTERYPVVVRVPNTELNTLDIAPDVPSSEPLSLSAEREPPACLTHQEKTLSLWESLLVAWDVILTGKLPPC